MSHKRRKSMCRKERILCIHIIQSVVYTVICNIENILYCLIKYPKCYCLIDIIVYGYTRI